MSPKYPLAALLLLAGCKKPDERARLATQSLLAHELAPTAGLDAGSLNVYPFPAAQLRYFTADVSSHGDGHLVTYACRPTAPAGPAQRFAVFVADTDSAFFFQPLRHADEFRQRYGVGNAAPPIRRR